MSGYFKREGDRGRQIQGVAKPILALLDWALFNALLKKGNLRLIQTDARILNRWIINCKNIRRTLSALRSTVFHQSVFMVMKINLKHSSCLKDDLLDTWCTASFYYSLVWPGGGGAVRKFTKTVCLCVRPSAWNNLAPIGRIFMKFNIRTFFENLPRKLKFHWNLTRTMGSLHEDQFTFYIISRSIRFKQKLYRHSKHTFYVQ